jgi:hypothetical protein
MRFWVREIAGWLLVGLGLYVFVLCYDLLLTERLIEAGPLTLIGIIIFRGGIHLLKVAVAARLCLHAQGEIQKIAAERRRLQV